MRDGSLARDSSAGMAAAGGRSEPAGLGLDFVDLYQVHWPDPDTPFAETAGALQELVEEGKIRHVGVSNFDLRPDGGVRRRPVRSRRCSPPTTCSAVRSRRSCSPTCREHDIGVLVYGPLAHGMLTGTFDEQMTFPAGDWRADAPFFRGEDFRRNLAAVGELGALAAELSCNVSQLAIAWTLANPAVDAAIVGSRNPRHVEEAADAAAIELSEDDLARIDRILADAVPIAGPSPEMGVD